jgi:hypothetical protein
MNNINIIKQLIDNKRNVIVEYKFKDEFNKTFTTCIINKIKFIRIYESRFTTYIEVKNEHNNFKLDLKRIIEITPV